jgi:hypothetical protein
VTEIQLKKTAEAAAKLARALEVVQGIFRDERPAYDSIVHERATLSSVIARDLVKKGLASPVPILRNFVEASGLATSSDLDSKAIQPDMQGEVLALLDRKSHQLENSSANASTEMDSALASLHRALQELAAGHAANLADVQSGLARVQAWLDLATAIRTAH